MSYRCTRRLQYAIGHRVNNHESKCARLHGHNYVFELTAEAIELDDVGRVIDFSVLKRVLGIDWLEKEWDHRFLLYEMDTTICGDEFDVPESELGILRVPFNPTAENMARHVLIEGNRRLEAYGVRLISVRVIETENCWSDAP